MSNRSPSRSTPRDTLFRELEVAVARVRSGAVRAADDRITYGG